MGLCEADLRRLDAHAHLGNLDFDSRPKEAIRYYEGCFRIGGLSQNSARSKSRTWCSPQSMDASFDSGASFPASRRNAVPTLGVLLFVFNNLRRDTGEVGLTHHDVAKIWRCVAEEMRASDSG